MTKIFFVLLLFITAMLTGCGSNYLAEEYEPELPVELEVEPTPEPPTDEPEPDASVAFPGKIAFITSGHSREQCSATTSLVETFGAENIIHFSAPRWNTSELSPIVERIAQDPEIKVVIINPARHTVSSVVPRLRKGRDDIFIIYIEHSARVGSEGFIDSITMANLILNANGQEITRTLPMRAQALGAETLVYFTIDFDNYDVFDWGYEYRQHSLAERRMMREASEAIGLNFVEVFRSPYAIGCMSDMNFYINETLPMLIEEHGRDIALMGLCSERLLWASLDHGLIYPFQRSDYYFLPSPYFIVQSWWGVPAWAGLEQDEFFRKENLPFVIEQTRAALEEINMLGRIATWPVSTHSMFTYVAVYYGIMWMNNDVPPQDICTQTLEQLMVDFIAQSLGKQDWGVALTSFAHDGVEYQNFILAFMDFMVY